MKIINEFPPNIEKIRLHLNPDEKTIYTYGDSLYVPNPDSIVSDDLMEHEETHAKEQIKYLTPDEWWEKYFNDPGFRLDQEVKAYHNQYMFYSKGKPREDTFFFLHRIAKDLSSPIYGSAITYPEAVKAIKTGVRK